MSGVAGAGGARGRALELAAWLLAAALLVASYLPLSPLSVDVPNRDSGVFLYAAEIILDGGMPYRDLWDHKPPGIYLVNALGLLLGRGSLWGPWAVELGLQLFALAAGWRLLRGFGTLPALLGNAAWILLHFQCSVDGRGGNVTEDYLLFPLFLALWAWKGRPLDALVPWRWLLIGATASLAALLKPTLVGTWGVMGLVAFLLGRRRVPREAGWLLLGVALPLVPVLAWLSWGGVLAEAWDQVVVYNRIYAAHATASDQRAVVRIILGVLWVGGGQAALLYFVYRAVRWEETLASTGPLVWVALAALPVEVTIASLAGRPYAHYYLPILPSIAVLTAAAASEVGRRAPPAHRRLALLVTGLGCALMFRESMQLVSDRVWLLPGEPGGDRVALLAAVAQVRTEVPPGAPVLAWGNEVTLHLLTRNPSPSRFAYSYPLYSTGYTRPDQVGEFLEDLRRDPPFVIFDASFTDAYVIPLDPEARARRIARREYQPSPALTPVLDWITQHYEPVDELAGGWIVYAPRAAR